MANCADTDQTPQHAATLVFRKAIWYNGLEEIEKKMIRCPLIGKWTDPFDKDKIYGPVGIHWSKNAHLE